MEQKSIKRKITAAELDETVGLKRTSSDWYRSITGGRDKGIVCGWSKVLTKNEGVNVTRNKNKVKLFIEKLMVDIIEMLKRLTLRKGTSFYMYFIWRRNVTFKLPS